MATTDQGLDPVVAHLRQRGYRFEVQQTGGMTMVVTIPYPDGVAGITENPMGDEHDEGPYLVCWYPGLTWDETGLPSDCATTSLAMLHSAIAQLGGRS